MNLLSRVLSAIALIASTGFATAQTMKPGLWEISNKMSGGSGEMEKGMADMQKQLANMPPEQRKMMEDMMAKQGVAMGAGGGGGMSAKVCLTKDMVERNEVATQQGDCQSTNSSRTGNTMKMAITRTVKGKPEKMNMDASGKFVSAECGNIKPIVIPKK